MNISKELQQVNNKIDKLNRKLAGAIERQDQSLIAETRNEIAAQQKKQSSLKNVRQKKTHQESQDLKKLPFSRVLTKEEQADLGLLKRKVKGIVVVHPLTALGREMQLQEVTGFASKSF